MMGRGNNRGILRKRMEELFHHPKKQGVILMLYPEDFRHMNDTFGAENAEALLEEMEKLLAEKTEVEVINGNGVEMVALLDGRDMTDAIRISGEVLERFSHSFRVGETRCLCKAQIGLLEYPGLAQTPEDALLYLDRAVREAENCGQNRYLVYDSEMHAEYVRRHTIAVSLREALTSGAVEVRYRPTYQVREKRFTRAEFYMRIFIPGIGMVGSQEFMPILEETGQVTELEYYALDKVCSLISQLIQKGNDFESVALPISADLLLQEYFVEKVKEALDRYEIPVGKLALEITENVLTSAYMEADRVLRALKDLGVEIILNNFGTGYSGISSILDLPVDVLKLERLFIWELETNERAADLIDGLISIADRLGLRIIAEGVETQHQVDRLNLFGCPYQQGFYYVPTVEAEVLSRVLGAGIDDALEIISEEKRKLQQY